MQRRKIRPLKPSIAKHEPARFDLLQLLFFPTLLARAGEAK
jgi:hypothetical protein